MGKEPPDSGAPLWLSLGPEQQKGDNESLCAIARGLAEPVALSTTTTPKPLDVTGLECSREEGRRGSEEGGRLSHVSPRPEVPKDKKIYLSIQSTNSLGKEEFAK